MKVLYLCAVTSTLEKLSDTTIGKKPSTLSIADTENLAFQILIHMRKGKLVQLTNVCFWKITTKHETITPGPAQQM